MSALKAGGAKTDDLGTQEQHFDFVLENLAELQNTRPLQSYAFEPVATWLRGYGPLQ